MYQKISHLLLFLLIAGTSFAQSLEKDLDAIATKMKESNSIALSVNVSVYTHKGGSKVYGAKASMQRMGKNTRNVLAELETIHTEAYDVKLDHEEKMVLILDEETRPESMDADQMGFDIKALKKLMAKDEEATPSSKVQLLRSEGSEKTYKISGTQGLDFAEITIDTAGYKIKKVIYKYGSASEGGNYVVLNYSQFDYDKDISSVFELTNLFQKEEGRYALKGAIKDYTLFTEE